jgi:hypothetical protein
VAKFNKLQNNFKSGQLSQLLDGRTDLKEYFSGLKTMRNAFPMRQGGAQKRSGTRFIADVTSNLKDELKGNAIKMIPFTTFDRTKYIFALVADTTKQNSEVYDKSYNMLFKEVNGEFVDVTATEYSLHDSLVSGATNDTMKNIHWTPYGNEVFFARGYNTHVDNELFARPATLYKYYPEADFASGDIVINASPVADQFYLKGTNFNVKGQTDVDSDTITETDHGLKNNVRVLYTQGSGGAIVGISNNTYYYVVNATTNTFQLSLTKGGAAISLSNAPDDIDDQNFEKTLQHSFVDGDEVQMTSSITLPTGISPNTSYYVKRVNDDEVHLYTDSALTTLVDVTAAGSGTHTLRHVTGKWKFHTLDQYVTDANSAITDTVFSRSVALARPYQLENIDINITFKFTTPDKFECNVDYFVAGHKGVFFKINDTTDEIILKVVSVTDANNAVVERVDTAPIGLLSGSPTIFWREDAWNDVAGYPGTVTNFEGRLIYGGTETAPGLIYISKTEDITVFMVNKLLKDKPSGNPPTANDNSGLAYFGDILATDAKVYGFTDTVDRRISFVNQGRALEVGTNRDVKIFNAPDGIGAEAPTINGTKPYFTIESETGSAAIQPARADQSTLYSETLVGISNFTLDTEIETRDRYISKQLSLLNEEIVEGSLELFYYDTFKRILYIVIKNENKYFLKGLYFDNIDDTAAWFIFDFAELASITDVYSIAGFDESPHNYIITTRKEVGAVGFEKKQIYLEKIEGATTKLLEAELDYLDLHINGDAGGTNEVSGLDHLFGLKDSDGNDVKVTVIGNIEFDPLKPDRYVVFKNLTVQFDNIDKYYVTLPSDIKEYIVGIQYSAELETMLIDGGLNVEGSSQGQIKRIDEVTLRMWNSTDLDIGDENGVFPVKFDDYFIYRR